MTDYAELKQMASASLGEWYVIGELRYEDRRSGDLHGLPNEDSEFIAAANPAAVLQLIAENERLRNEAADALAVNRTIRQQLECYFEDAGRMDWLDTQSRPVIDGRSHANPEGECVGYEWAVDGPYSTVREAIDEAIGKESI